MKARAVIRLGWATIPASDRHAANIGDAQTVEITGDDAPDWEAAKASIVVPEGGQIIALYRDE